VYAAWILGNCGAPDRGLNLSVVDTSSFSPPAVSEQQRAQGSQPAREVYLSVVIPAYGSASSLPVLHQRLTAVLSGLTESYEIVFVEDCSPDNSWDVLAELAKDDEKVRAFKLSRNFGQHAAITAGLAQSRGKWVVVMDCDLQDPPEEIPRLYDKALEGHDVVLARRKQRQHSQFRLLCARAYFALLNTFANAKFNGEYGCFSLVSRKVVDAYIAFSERNRHYLLILNWLGFDVGEIEYQHGKRHAGSSSYSFARLIAHALQGIFFQTTILLRLIVTTGLVMSLVGVLWAVQIGVSCLLYSALPGWTSLAMFILVIGGMILFALGVVGLYVGEIFEQVKDRPLYVIAKEAKR